MTDGTFRLIDLDATVRIGEPAGEKTSTAFCPPEMTFEDADNDLVCFKTPDAGAERCDATPAFDFWALGCVMYRALTRAPLFEANDADNIRNSRELKRLNAWGADNVGAALRDVCQSLRDTPNVSDKQSLLACDVVGWLLQREPSARPQSATSLLSHALFLDTAQGPERELRSSTEGNPADGAAGGARTSAAGTTRTNMSSLHVAAALGEIEIVEQTLGSDEATVADSILSKENILGRTPLHLAVVGLREATVRFLLFTAAASQTTNKLSLFRKAESQTKSSRKNSTFHSLSLTTAKSEQARTLLYRCTSAVDDQHETPLHSVVKVVEGLSTADLETSMRIVEALATVTDLSLADSHGHTVLDMGCASPVKLVRGYFVRLRERQIEKKRRALFSETMLEPADGAARIPWGLPAGDLQAWVRTMLPSNAKPSLIEIVDAIEHVDGFTLLSECVEMNRTNVGLGNWNRKEFEKQLASKIKVSHHHTLVITRSHLDFCSCVRACASSRSQQHSRRCCTFSTLSPRAIIKQSYYRAWWTPPPSPSPARAR